MPTAIGAPPAMTSATHASANQAIEWELHPKTNRVTVLFVSNSGRVSFQGTEGAALASSNSAPVAADAPLTLTVSDGVSRVQGLTLYTSADVGSTVVSLITDAG